MSAHNVLGRALTTLCVALLMDASLWPYAAAADLPVPCIGGNCAGGPGVWVTGGEATASITGSQLVIDQASDRAILNWASFDVAADGEVIFRQPTETSIALNRIFQQDPSVILGAVSANGQVYLINPNGLIFGEGASIQVQSLIASSLDVNDAIFESVGVVRAIEQDGEAAFEGGSAPDARIEVRSGAELVAAGGGRIVLLAPEVVNRGRIETPDGQAVLAASADRVFLQASDDSNLRGLLVEVDTGGTVTNFGQIAAARGNVTLAGLAVNQQGLVSATTSVRTNGSVRLQARDQAEVVFDTNERPKLNTLNAGTLTLGSGSVTEVTPELTDTAVAVDEQAQALSEIRMMGRQITFESGSVTRADGGQIVVDATVNPRAIGTVVAQNNSQIFIADGAVIDVSGVDDTVVAMERNVVEVELRGNELADAPLQREGVLRGEAVRVDVRVGTPLANVDGALASIERGVGERLSTGGTVALSAEGSVVIGEGARIDVSGGQVAYEEGYIDTTKLISGGEIVDIGVADPNVVYGAIASGYVKEHERWGVIETFPEFGGSQGTFEAGYVEGKDAGSVSVLAPDVVLDGAIVAERVIGDRQRQPTNLLIDGSLRPFDQVPAGGGLTVNLATSPEIIRNVVFGTGVPTVIAPGAVLPSGRTANVPVAVFNNGLNRFSLVTNGAVSVGSEIAIELAPGGSFGLLGSAIDMNGQIRASAGTIQISSTELSGANAPVVIGQNALIDVSGRWVNDFLDADSGALKPLWIDAGRVAVDAGGDLTLVSGARIVANGGAAVAQDGQVVAGRGGDVALGVSRERADSAITLEGEVEALALREGGALEITANRIVVGDASSEVVAPPTTLVLDNVFFEQSGFGRYALTANRGGLLVSEQADLTLRQRNGALAEGYLQIASGATLPRQSASVLLPELERAPVSLALRSTLATVVDALSADANLVFAPGSIVRLDPEADVTLSSQSSLFFDGRLEAPSANVVFSLSNVPESAVDPGYRGAQQIRLGGQSVIDTRGRVLVLPDDSGYRRGRVTDGGRVALMASRGAVIAEAGSRVDVSGVSGTLDLTLTDPTVLTPVRVAGAAGEINIAAAEAIVLDGQLLARSAGTPESVGGSLSVTLNQNLRAVDVNDPVLFPTYPTVPSRITLAATTAPVALDRETPLPEQLLGRARISQALIEGGGFADATLAARDYISGNVRVAGSIRIDSGVDLAVDGALALDAAIVEMLGGNARIEAPFVALGSSQIPRLDTRTPTLGSSTLSVSGETIDLRGPLLLDGVAQLSLLAQQDVRLRGELPDRSARELTGSLTSAGSVEIAARRLYPGTLSSYTFDLVGDNSRFALTSSGTAAAPFSAGGALTVNARDVDINGNMFAPLGDIELNASGDLTLGDAAVVAVASDGREVLFGRTQGEIDWVYPISATQNLIFGSGENTLAPPSRRVRFDAERMNLAPGSIVNLEGGGDVYAYEFVPGPGGSTDILDPLNAPGSFAIVPGFESAYAPLDPLESIGFGYENGTRVVVAGGSGLPAGEYTVLPPRYALLPGAFLLSERAGTLDALPGVAIPDPDGVLVIAARLGDAAGGLDSRWQGFRVENGVQVRARAEYIESRGNQFFADQAASQDRSAPLLARDAGSLILDVGSSASLRAQVRASGVGVGLGGRVDIAAQDIAVVNQLGDAPDQVELLASELNALTVDSLSIGGVREQSDNQTVLGTRSQRVLVDDGVALTAPELILAGQAITIGNDVTLANSGSTSSSQALVAQGDGALVVVSSADIDDYQRTDVSDTTDQTSSLTIGEGSVLQASASLILDSTGNIEQRGELGASGGRVTLAASRIGLGEAPADATGLILDATQINQLDASELVLLSRSAVDLFGDLDLSLARLELRGAGLIGRQSAGVTATLNADTLAFSNPFGAVDDGGTDGAGALRLVAQQILFGDGDYAIAGFESIVATVAETIAGAGDGRVSLLADTVFSTAGVVAQAGAMLEIEAGERSLQIQGNGAELNDEGGLGSEIRLSAGSLGVAAPIVAPGGVVTLTADSLALNDGARLDVAGTSVDFGGVVIDVAGGDVALTAREGDVVLTADTQVDVSGGGDASAGTLEVSAANGSAQLDGVVRADGGGGRAIFDVAHLDAFSDLNATLAAGGFDGERRVRVRSGDLTVDDQDVVLAERIALSTDDGALTINGTLRAAGGDIALSASDAVRINGRVDVGSDTTGGDILLRASAEDAVITLGATSQLSLGGATRDGTLQVFLNEAGGALSERFSASGAIDGALLAMFAPERTVTVADQVLSNEELGSFLEEMFQSASAMDFGFLDEALWQVRPSLVVQAPDDLTLSGDINLQAYRLNDLPGSLTLRAAGDLTIEGDLSDGVSAALDFSEREIALLDTGPSFALTLVSGADLGASAPGQVASDGDITLGDAVVVRTGTGDIALRAAGSLLMGEGASVYTAGVSTGTGTLPTQLNDFVFPGVEYPEAGGDVDVRVGGDIVSVDAGQLFNDWLHRAGGDSETFGQVPTLYGVFVQGFAQSFGALGGGNVALRAGGAMRDVSVALPATAQHTGNATLVPGTTLLVTTDASFTLRDSGSLDIDSGADVEGLVAYVATGEMDVRARGNIAPTAAGRGAILALGNAPLRLTATGDVNIESIFNPTVLPQSANQPLVSSFGSQFFTYGERSAASIVSTAGSVIFDNSSADIADSSVLNFGNPGSFLRAGLQVYPSRLAAAALSGDILLNNRMTLFPDANGNLDLLARGSVATLDRIAAVRISNADVALLPGVNNPDETAQNLQQRLTGAGRGQSELVDAAVPVHIGDQQTSRVIALDGSVIGTEELGIVSAEAIEVRAGLDVRNVDLLAQNVRDDDVTRVVAGRDVRFDTRRDENGRIFNRNNGLEIAGPGRLDVLAGRDIDLGASDGVISIGDRVNQSLADQGADITLLAGLAEGADFNGFVQSYLIEGDDFQSELEAYVSGLTGVALGGQDARDAFLELPPEAREPLVLAAFFAELRQSGVESPDPEIGFERGFAAIQTLFPEERNYAGDLRIFFSRVQTTDGGDISVGVPGGEVNAGLAAIFEGAKSADKLGIVVQGDGSINAFVRDDFLVNQSRVFALDGGDILVWSTEGDIDAGRGAKTALAAPEPVVTVDSAGNVLVDFPPTISGSGIRAGVSTRDREPGDVFLFAPDGVVSAGDAGIGSAGNVTIAATEVIGADNIDVGGTAIGVPVDTGGVAAGLSGVSNATAGAANAGTDQVNEHSNDEGQAEESFGSAALAWLDLMVVGFGDENERRDDDED